MDNFNNFQPPQAHPQQQYTPPAYPQYGMPFVKPVAPKSLAQTAKILALLSLFFLVFLTHDPFAVLSQLTRYLFGNDMVELGTFFNFLIFNSPRILGLIFSILAVSKASYARRLQPSEDLPDARTGHIVGILALVLHAVLLFFSFVSLLIALFD